MLHRFVRNTLLQMSFDVLQGGWVGEGGEKGLKRRVDFPFCIMAAGVAVDGRMLLTYLCNVIQQSADAYG